MKWQSVCCSGSKPPPRYRHSAVVWNGFMLIYGGYDGVEKFSDMHKLSLVSWEWEKVDYSCRPDAYPYHTCTINPWNRLYIFGGSQSQQGDPIDQNIFDLNNQSWLHSNMRGDIPSARSFHSCACAGSKLILFGGYNGVSFANVEFDSNR